MRRDVLRMLKESDGPVSGRVLAENLSVSRTAVWKHIERLREEGYDIGGAQNVGYTLRSTPDRFSVEELSALLPGAFTGQIVCLNELTSTNDEAKALAAAGKLSPAGLVVAESQTGGRGRFGRPWSSPRGGIWMSVVLRPRMPANAAGRAALLAAVAIAEAIKETTGLGAKIKWPNDVLIRGRKVSGVLIEMAAELGLLEYLVIGIGINANFGVADLKDVVGATTLRDELGRPVDRLELLGRIVDKLLDAAPGLAHDFKPVLEAWRRLSDTIGAQIKLDDGVNVVSGRAIDIDDDGGLIVETAPGQRRVFRAGDIS